MIRALLSGVWSLMALLATLSLPFESIAASAPDKLIAQELYFRLNESRTVSELLAAMEIDNASRASLAKAFGDKLESPLPYSTLNGSTILLGSGKERWILDFTRIHEHLVLVNSSLVRADQSVEEILGGLIPKTPSPSRSSFYPSFLLPKAQAAPLIPIVATGALAVALIPGVASTLIQKSGEMYDEYFAAGGKARVWESDADKFRAEVEKKGLKLQKFSCEGKKLATLEYTGQFGMSTNLRPTYENGKAVNIKRTNRSNAQGSIGSEEQYFLNSDERITSIKRPGQFINQPEPTPLSELVRPFPIERALACCAQNGCETEINRGLTSASAKNPMPASGGAVR